MAAALIVMMRHVTNRQPLLYNALLQSELLGENIDPASMNPTPSPLGSGNGGGGSTSSSGNVDGGWRMIGASNSTMPFSERCERSNNLQFNPTRQYYHNSMYGLNNHTDGGHQGDERRPLSIVNSFRLSPLSMSPNQHITLDTETLRITHLCDLSPSKDVVTSVAWSEGGRHLDLHRHKV